MLLPVGLMVLVLVVALGAALYELKRRYIDKLPPEADLGPKEHEMTADPDLSNPPLVRHTPSDAFDHRSAVLK